MTRAEIARREAWHSAAWTSAMDLGAGILAALVVRAWPWLPTWVLLQFAATGGLVLVVLFACRDAPRGLCLVLFSVNVASALVTALAAANALARSGHVGQPFEALIAGLMLIAILSPSIGLGVAWIAVFTLAPWIAVHCPEFTQKSFLALDLWFIPIYAGMALVVLLYRSRCLHLENTLSNARAEQLMLERLGRVSLVLGDFANTPLQTLTTGVSLLRHKAQPQDRVRAAMERALGRLQRLKQALMPFDYGVEVSRQEESFDAIASIVKIADDLGRGRDR